MNRYAQLFSRLDAVNQGAFVPFVMLGDPTPELSLAIVDALVGMLDPGAVLVIRTGLDDGSPRARITRAGDFLARGLRWMNAAPRHYPEAAMLRARFEAAGLRSEFTPLYGDTPFNNWRIVAWRE